MIIAGTGILTALAEDFTIDKLKTLTYIADSAFVTTTNLELTEKLGMKFISRLPANYELEEKLTLKAFADDNWIELGQLAQGKDKAQYRHKEYKENLNNHKYRFLVVHSSQLDKRKLKKLDNQVKKEHPGKDNL